MPGTATVLARKVQMLVTAQRMPPLATSRSPSEPAAVVRGQDGDGADVVRLAAAAQRGLREYGGPVIWGFRIRDTEDGVAGDLYGHDCADVCLGNPNQSPVLSENEAGLGRLTIGC